jgi:hypothetical protein
LKSYETRNEVQDDRLCGAEVGAALGPPNAQGVSGRNLTFVHENFGHVAFYVSGASQMILEKFDGDSEAADAWEELLVQKLELVWYPLLKQFNFQFPKPAPKQA